MQGFVLPQGRCALRGPHRRRGGRGRARRRALPDGQPQCRRRHARADRQAARRQAPARLLATSRARTTRSPPRWRRAAPTGASRSRRWRNSTGSGSCRSRRRTTISCVVESRRERPAVQAFLAALRDEGVRAQIQRARHAPRRCLISCYSRDDGSRSHCSCCCRALSQPPSRRTRSCAAMAGRCARSRSRRTASRRSPAASTPRRSAGRWRRAPPREVLRFHDGAVNAVALLRDGRAATSGEDARIAIWKPGEAKPVAVLEGHKAPVVALAVSPDGATLASASWDHTARLWPLAGGEPRVLEGHKDNVNGVAFTPDGKSVVTAGYDATLRIWPLAGGAPEIVTLPTPLNTVAVAPDGEIVAAGADGKVYFLTADGELRGEVEVGTVPIIAVTISRRRQARRRRRHPRLGRDHRSRDAQARTHAGRARPAGLVGGVLPRQPHAAHRRHRPHDPALGRDQGRADRRRARSARRRIRSRPMPAIPAPRSIAPASPATRSTPMTACAPARRLPASSAAGSRRCPATISPRRSRRWTSSGRRRRCRSCSRSGPTTYTPGTKMPEQRIGSPEDRAALMRFLEKTTKKG